MVSTAAVVGLGVMFVSQAVGFVVVKSMSAKGDNTVMPLIVQLVIVGSGTYVGAKIASE